MTYKPNFIVNDEGYILSKLEEILIIFPYLSLIDEISDEELQEIFELLRNLNELNKFIDKFKVSLSKEDVSDYDEQKKKYEFKVIITGPSKIQKINPILYYVTNFFYNKDAFLRIYETEIFKDEFGVRNKDNWEKKFKSFFENFIIKKNILHSNISHRDFYKKNHSLNMFFEKLTDFYIFFSEKYSRSNFYRNNSQNDKQFFTSSEKGITFEKECSIILENSSWITEFTPKTGDKGADIIAKKGKIKLVVQCKFYEKPVGSDAVQQIYTAKSFFDATIAAVVSKSGFTKSAEQIAEKTNVLLLTTSDLKDI